MEIATRDILQRISETASPSYRATATALLAGELDWTPAEIEQFIDAAFHDPFLTRNE